MKEIHISSPSHSPTPIFMDQPSSSSSSSHPAATPLVLAGSGGGGGGSRAIDRHNPIITDERRIGRTPPNSSHPSPFTPKPSPLNLLKTPKTPKTPKNKDSVISASKAKKLIGLTKIKTSHDHHEIHAFRKGPSTPSDLITVKGGGGDTPPSKARADHVSPPESSRYLLNENEDSFLDTLSDFDPFLKLEASIERPETPPSTSHEVAIPESEEACKASTKPPIPSPPKSSAPSLQVVVLRVSLHCRGCEGKVRKHISRMRGVTSFNIDFAAKKVTVVGDVTPLEVIASISKVKAAQVWTPTMSGPRATEVGTKKM